MGANWGINEMGGQWDGGPVRWGTNEMGDQWDGGPMMCTPSVDCVWMKSTSSIIICAKLDHSIQNFNSKKFIVSLSTNEYWTLIQVHNHKHDSGLGTTLRDISKLYFFAGWKHVDCAGTAAKKSTVVTSHGGCPTKVLNCLTQNKTFLLY